MKSFDPKQREEYRKRRATKVRVLLSFLIIFACFLVFSILRAEDEVVPVENISTVVEVEEPQEELENIEVVDNNVKELRIFTDNEFKVFFDQLLQPNLDRVVESPPITGNDIADARIKSIAEERGYRLRSSPNVSLVSVDGYLLHEAVSSPWFDLKAAAAEQGHTMNIVSAYRSVERQRQLFTSRLGATGATVAQVAAGTADTQVDQVLVTSSIPGYSKHHTGYTIDLVCAGYAFESFKDSPCNTWLVADNYRVAKEHGFIPSYPPLADAQGPDPEAWEYVYVGTDLLYE